MRQKIGENAVIFLFLFAFISFCWLSGRREIGVDATWVEVGRREKPSEAAWESPYPASLLPNEKININLAGAEDLARIPSIGEVSARNIEAYRQENGTFETAEELLEVYGIGKTTLEAILPYITLD